MCGVAVEKLFHTKPKYQTRGAMGKIRKMFVCLEFKTTLTRLP